MRRTIRIVLLPLMILLFNSSSFGWGNLTHVYLVKEVGKTRGLVNLLETYGSVLTDAFNLQLDQSGVILADQLHNYPGQFGANPTSGALKAVAFGVYHHNNEWGVDNTAHHDGLTAGEDVGWVIYKANQMAPELVPTVKEILLDAGLDPTSAELFAWGLAPELGHVLVETAVDVLVRRSLDRAAGGRLALAAQVRPASVGQTLVNAYGGTPEVTMTGEEIIAAEEVYRQQMIEYGQAFLLPEGLLIRTLAASTVPVAEMYIEAALYEMTGFPVDVTVEAETVREFILRSMDHVSGDYQAELAATLAYIRGELDSRGIQTCESIFALGKEGEVGEELQAVPPAFSLAQNYPNPFNPETSISYALPVDTRVTLSVFNALGQEVANLVDGEMLAGVHSVKWNASGLASGVYFYRIAAEGFVETKRLILTK
ncbi:MAG: T9SS type A sorting domain-containing protein [Bacteroidota bacterium]